MALKVPYTDTASRAGEVREIPICLPSETVRSLLNGTVSQLRFPVQGNPRFAYACVDARGELNGDFFVSMPSDATIGMTCRCPFGNPGDVLWVREDWTQVPDGSFCYRVRGSDDDAQDADTAWNGAASMPRSASRLQLAVQSRGVVRLHAMTGNDARAQGYVSVPGKIALNSFREAWDATYPNSPWRQNPWVWTLKVASLPGAVAPGNA